uniref:CSON010564 protein n=1 Tax=Culicoides sonorensis TaxID=179676 RepID=A0A336MDY1_CULSO
MAEIVPDPPTRPSRASAQRPELHVFKHFTQDEFYAFLGIFIVAGVHRSNKENVDDLWNPDSIPLIRATTSKHRFKFFLRCIRFDNQNTREERLKTDKAAPIADIWLLLNNNLQKCYKPSDCITVDEQLFPFRGHTRFTQYIPSKPSKYGIKFFWAADPLNAYPLKGIIYTGKPNDGVRQTNIGERTVLDLVKQYKGSGRNVTTDNFFTTFSLAMTLKDWQMTLVGTVRRNKRFVPANMQPAKERPVHSTNTAFTKYVTMCSYVPKKNKSVIMLSSMHQTCDIDATAKTKPEIINYYNSTKGGVDTMDKMLSEYTVKRRTSRWPLAVFFNMIDVAGLAAYIIFSENNCQTKNRRVFLKTLAKQLCRNQIETRISDGNQMKNSGTRRAIETVLDQEIIGNVVASENNSIMISVRQGGRCYVCKSLNNRQRKTRKSCDNCNRPVCAEHSSEYTKCDNCAI